MATSNCQSKQQKRPRKKRGQSNRECGSSHRREVESSLVLASRCRKKEKVGPIDYKRSGRPVALTSNKGGEVRPLTFRKAANGKRTMCLARRRASPLCLFVFKEERGCSSNDCFAVLSPHHVSYWDNLSRHNNILFLLTTYSYAIVVLNFIHTQLAQRSYPSLS